MSASPSASPSASELFTHHHTAASGGRETGGGAGSRERIVILPSFLPSSFFLSPSHTQWALTHLTTLSPHSSPSPELNESGGEMWLCGPWISSRAPTPAPAPAAAPTPAPAPAPAPAAPAPAPAPALETQSAQNRCVGRRISGGSNLE